MENRLDIDCLNPKNNTILAGDTRLIELGEVLRLNRDFFADVKSFLLALESQAGSVPTVLVSLFHQTNSPETIGQKSVARLLKQKRNIKSGGKFWKFETEHTMQKQLEVVVAQQKALLVKAVFVKKTGLSDQAAAIAKSARRSFASASAAQKFCLEKRQAAMLEASGLPRVSMAKKPTDFSSFSKNYDKETVKQKKIRDAISHYFDSSIVSISDVFGATMSTKTSDADPKSRASHSSRSIQESSVDVPEEMRLDDEDFKREHFAPARSVLTPAAMEIHGAVEEEKRRLQSREADNGEIPFEGELYARALYDFKAEAKNELSMTSGDVFEVISRKTNGWWLVSDKDRKLGFVPSNYVELISDHDYFKKQSKYDQLTQKKEEVEEDYKSSRSPSDFSGFLEGDSEGDRSFSTADTDDLYQALRSQLERVEVNGKTDPSAAEPTSLRCQFCGIELSPEEFYEIGMELVVLSF